MNKLSIVDYLRGLVVVLLTVFFMSLHVFFVANWLHHAFMVDAAGYVVLYSLVLLFPVGSLFMALKWSVK